MCDEIEDSGVIPYEIFVRPYGSVYDIYLNDYIDAPRRYTKLFRTLENVTKNDLVNIYINSGGGRLDTGSQLISAMENCAGTVQTIVQGSAMSMAAYIFMAGDILVIGKHSNVMFHHASWGQQGKGSEILNYAKLVEQQTRSLLEDYTLLFFTEEERNRILYGEDLYFTDEEVLQRFPLIGEYEPESRSVTKYSKEELLARHKESLQEMNSCVPKTTKPKPQRKK